MNPLDIEATPLRLRELVRRKALAKEKFDDAVDLVSGAYDPRRALQAVLLAMATALIVAGVAFFVAANWQALGKFARLGLVAAFVVAGVVVSVVVSPRSVGGRAALTVSGLVTGPALFLFGQTYQTGADAWELFAGWLLLLLPFAFAARFAGLWWIALLLLHAATLLFLDQRFDLSDDDIVVYGPFFVVADAAALVISDVMARRNKRRALSRGTAVIFAVSCCIVVVAALWGRRHDGWQALSIGVVVVGAAWLVLSRRRDLMRAALGLFVTGVGIAFALARWWFDFWHLEVGGIFLEGAVILAVVGVSTALLRKWHRELGAPAEDEP